MKDRARHLKQTFKRRKPAIQTTGHERDFYAGYELRTDPSAYSWDGLKRGGDPGHPFVLFQYTLDGWGCYAEGPLVRRVPRGTAFLAVVPGPHRYFLPPDSPRWEFFWIILHHPYVVKRLAERIAQTGALVQIDPTAPMLAKAIDCFTRVCRGGFKDRWHAEQSAFDFLVEYERFIEQAHYPRPPRERLLQEVREAVLADLRHPIDVEALARPRELSRSHFSHYFKITTGLSPAVFMTQVRLEEASRRLTTTGDKLAGIARATGFADANHFCKVFRRHYHTSPGAFRRQLG